MQPIGKEVQESLEFIPAKAILKRDIYYTYACENCKENDISTPIVKTPKDVTLIPGSYASPEAVAYIAVKRMERSNARTVDVTSQVGASKT